MTKFFKLRFFLANAEMTDPIFEERTTPQRSTNNKKVGNCYRTVNAEQEHGETIIGAKRFLKCRSDSIL